MQAQFLLSPIACHPLASVMYPLLHCVMPPSLLSEALHTESCVPFRSFIVPNHLKEYSVGIINSRLPAFARHSLNLDTY